MPPCRDVDGDDARHLHGQVAAAAAAAAQHAAAGVHRHQPAAAAQEVGEELRAPHMEWGRERCFSRCSVDVFGVVVSVVVQFFRSRCASLSLRRRRRLFRARVACPRACSCRARRARCVRCVLRSPRRCVVLTGTGASFTVATMRSHSSACRPTNVRSSNAKDVPFLTRNVLGCCSSILPST